MTHNQFGGTVYRDHAIHIGDNNFKTINIQREPWPEIDLGIALQTFQTLPTEVVPTSKADKLPAWSRFTRLQQGYFVGRDTEILEIAHTLKQGNTCLITTGIGGIGKSALASEFAYRYGSYFVGGVFWLSFADPQNIDNEISDCGTKLRLFHEHEDLTLEQRVERVKIEWQKPIPRLLIFDNCDQLTANQCRDFLSKYLPMVGGCRVLITSRNSVWPIDTKLRRLALEILERSQSIQLLQHYRPDLNKDEANEIAEELGDLPLALTLAGRYLADVAGERYGQTSIYLQNLRQKKLEHTSLDSEEQGELSVKAAIELSYQRLHPEQDVLAISLLHHASYFAPNQPFLKTWLHSCIEGYDPDDETQGRQRNKALQRLLELGLLEQVDQDQLRIHRLIQYFHHITTSNQIAQEKVEVVLNDIAHITIDSKKPLQLMLIMPHLYNYFNQIEQQDNIRVAKLLMSLGSAELLLSNYQQAQYLLEKALNTYETLLGSYNHYTASSLNNLASLYEHQGHYHKAEPLYQKSLSINKIICGFIHTNTAMSLNNLAMLYKNQGKYDEAEPLFLQALHINETILGSEHPDTAMILNNLAGLYELQEHYDKAEPLFLQALKIHNQLLGFEHLDTAMSLNNLAMVYKNQGRYDEAEPLFLQALHINETILGSEHPDTALSLNNLAFLYNAQGMQEKAAPLYARSLRIYKKVLGSEHPDTAMSLNNLAMVYKNQGKYDEAEPLFQEALRIKQAFPETEYLDIVPILDNIADIYVQKKQYVEAATLFEDVLRIREVFLEINDPLIAISTNNLACMYREQGKYIEAETLFLKAIQIGEIAWGKEHKYTQNSHIGLKMNQYFSNQYSQALSVVQQALNNPDINRWELVKRIKTNVQSIVGNEKENSPYYVLGERILALIKLLDLENYNLPSLEHKIAQHLAQAQAVVQEALGDPSIERQALAQQLEANAQQAVEGEEAGSPWYMLAQQFRDLITQLDLENYTPPSQDQQIATVLANAQSAVELALNDANIDREALTKQLEEAAQYYAEGEEVDSPWYVLAEQFRALAAQLHKA